jgi:hypothetical protein
MRYQVFTIAIIASLLWACGTTPITPSAQDKLNELDALYGEVVVVDPGGHTQSKKDCAERPNYNPTVKRICGALPTSDEVTVNITSSFWGGVSKQVLLIPRREHVRKGDIVKFRPRDNLFGFIKVAAHAGDPNCRWESGLIKGATAQGVVCEGYDYRRVLEILAE